RRPPRRQAADDLPYVVPADRIEGRRGFVQEDELRLSQERRAKAQALLHSLGEGANPIAGALGQANRLERGPDLVLPARPRQGRQLTVQGKYLGRREPALVAEQLGQVTDAAPGLQVSHRPAEKPALARGRRQEAEQ